MPPTMYLVHPMLRDERAGSPMAQDGVPFAIEKEPLPRSPRRMSTEGLPTSDELARPPSTTTLRVSPPSPPDAEEIVAVEVLEFAGLERVDSHRSKALRHSGSSFRSNTSRPTARVEGPGPIGLTEEIVLVKAPSPSRPPSYTAHHRHKSRHRHSTHRQHSDLIVPTLATLQRVASDASQPGAPEASVAAVLPTANATPPALSLLARTRAALNHTKSEAHKQVGGRFLLSLIDPREIVYPLTLRRAAYFSVYAGAIVGLVLLDRHYQMKDKVVTAIRYQNLVLMGIIYGLEPALFLFLFLCAHYPPAAPQRTLAKDASRADRIAAAKTQSTAYVVPCHNSDEASLQRSLKAALRHFAPEQIFVVDNADLPAPQGRLEDVAHDAHPDIAYMWSPRGSKNFAQYVGSLAAAKYEYIITSDDDVCLPANFTAPHHLLDEKTKGVAIPIEAVDRAGKRPWFVGWQDLEYKLAGAAKLAEARAGGVLFPHGACSFWDREAFLEVLRRHDLEFFADDCKLGFATTELGYRLAFDATQRVSTEAPETIVGRLPNWYAQRVRSWEMGRHIITPRLAKSLFDLKGKDTVQAVAMHELMNLYALASNAIDLFRLPFYMAMGHQKSFWVRTGALSGLPIVLGLVFKYIKCRHRPDLAPKLTTVLSFPIYKTLYSGASILAAARSLYLYWPSHKKKPTIPQMEANDDPRCFYRDDLFAVDPGYLAHRRDRSEQSSLATFMAGEDFTLDRVLAPLPEPAAPKEAAAQAAV